MSRTDGARDLATILPKEDLTRPCRAWHKRVRGTLLQANEAKQYVAPVCPPKLPRIVLPPGVEALHNGLGSPGLVTFTDKEGTEAFAMKFLETVDRLLAL